MGPFLTTLATVLLFCGIGIAQADEQTDKLTNANATVGIGMICNTPEQAERAISACSGPDKGRSPLCKPSMLR